MGMVAAGEKFQDSAAKSTHAGIILDCDNPACFFSPLDNEFIIQWFDKAGIYNRSINANLFKSFSCFQGWIDLGEVAAVSDQQALAWYETNTELRAVVAAPWVLVQQRV